VASMGKLASFRGDLRGPGNQAPRGGGCERCSGGVGPYRLLAQWPRSSRANAGLVGGTHQGTLMQLEPINFSAGRV
jgi:hypothetical protein